MLKNVLTHDATDNSVQLYIDLRERNLQVNGHKVESITQYAGVDFIGDLGVNWAASADDSYTEGGLLLMRNTHSNDANTATMGEFYWERVFNDELKAILAQHGFSDAAQQDVFGSEWGMQDVGRASYDAQTVGEEMLAVFNLTCEWSY